MGQKRLIVILLALLLGALFMFYSFMPLEDLSFAAEANPSFSLGNNTVMMQFYENMRFPYSKITYEIDPECSIRKKSDMREAFEIIENQTILEFDELSKNGEIFITCQDTNRVEDGMFIAGEGGPTKIISGETFNVIFHGNILLIRDSKCSEPNVAVHELLHVLGFDHSENPQNLMYPVSKCSQTIGDEITGEIDRLYSIPPYPDLFFQNASGKKEGRYLDLNLTIRNSGLIPSPKSNIVIYNEDKKIKEIELDTMDVGIGMSISLKNLDLKLNKIEKIRIVIENDYDELSKDNNEIVLSSI